MKKMEHDVELKCIFENCSKSGEEIKPLSEVRLQSIACASEERADKFSETVERLKANGVVLASQKLCFNIHIVESHCEVLTTTTKE